MEQHGQRIHNMFNMLSSLPPFWLSLDFPPWAVADLILPNNGILPRTSGLQEIEKLLAFELEIQLRGSFSHTPNHTTIPRELEVRKTDFAKDLCDQFREKNMIDVIEKFNKLRHKGSVTDYQIRFEELKSLMLTL